MRGAEDHLRTAIDLSQEREAFPHTFMTILYMKKEDWLRASESGLKASILEPTCPTTLLRLSSCYSQQNECAKAHFYCERALSLLPLPERISYLDKLQRLKEQSLDAKSKPVAIDPFNVLPLEVIINIMRFGLDENKYFVLTSSWVCQGWRAVLNNDCPELWKTWEASHTSLKQRYSAAKQSEWIKRAGSSVGTILFKRFGRTAAGKVLARLGKYAAGIKRIEITSAGDSLVLGRLAVVLGGGGGSPVQLRLTMGEARVHHNPFRDITCGLAANLDQLRTVEVSNVYFEASIDIDSLTPPFKIAEPVILRYPNLERLVLRRCAFDNAYAFSISDGMDYQADCLHTALRGATALEHLEVSIGLPARRIIKAGCQRKIVLSSLTTLKLPPPSVWHVDIEAPNLKSIAYELRKHWPSESIDQFTLLPRFDQLPFNTELLFKLESVELVCDINDKEPRLEEWLVMLHDVNRFVIRNIGAQVYPIDATTNHGSDDLAGEIADDRASVHVLRLLQHRLPKLQDLTLERCHAPGKELVEYVRERMHTVDYVPLRRLTLTGCSKLSAKAKCVLEQEVTEIAIIREFDNPYDWRDWRGPSGRDLEFMERYMDDDFAVESAEAK